jgi:hypothetical protein
MMIFTLGNSAYSWCTGILARNTGLIPGFSAAAATMTAIRTTPGGHGRPARDIVAGNVLGNRLRRDTPAP